MSAADWMDNGYKAKDFHAYGALVTLASSSPGELYIEITDEEDSKAKVCFAVESKEIMRMATWIIKEHG